MTGPTSIRARLRWARVTVAIPLALFAGALAAACTSGDVMLGTDRSPDATPPIADAEVPEMTDGGDGGPLEDSGFFGDDAAVDDGGFLDGGFLDGGAFEGGFLDGSFLDGGAG